VSTHLQSFENRKFSEIFEKSRTILVRCLGQGLFAKVQGRFPSETGFQVKSGVQVKSRPQVKTGFQVKSGVQVKPRPKPIAKPVPR
jgi:hypothetical protein